MNKQLLGLALVASIASAGLAQAQTPSASPPAVTRTTPAVPSITMTTPAMPSMTMTTPAVPAATFSMSRGELATIGVGAVAGAMLFQATMIHGMALVGAVVGGWVGSVFYGHYIAPQPAT